MGPAFACETFFAGISEFANFKFLWSMAVSVVNSQSSFKTTLLKVVALHSSTGVLRLLEYAQNDDFHHSAFITYTTVFFCKYNTLFYLEHYTLFSNIVLLSTYSSVFSSSLDRKTTGVGSQVFFYTFLFNA